MKKELSFNVTSEVLKAFETATLISEMLYDDKVRTAYLLMGLLNLDNTAINELFYEEYGLIISIPETMKGFINNFELLSELLGEEAAAEIKKNIDELEGEAFSQEENKNAEEEEPKDSSNTSIKEEVFKALQEIAKQNEEAEIANQLLPVIDSEYSSNLEEAIIDAVKRCKGNIINSNNMLYSLLLNKEYSSYKLMESFTSFLSEYEMSVENIRELMEINVNIYMASDKDEITIPKTLEGCCELFNAKFQKGQKNEIVGRDKQKKALWNIFSKKDKKNAILVGPAGSGKTAIIESITQDIVNGVCPKRFINYNVISFNTAAAVAGTKYRGEFETKIIMLKRFIEQTPNVILFIDEIHSIVGAGTTSEDSNDLSGALKSTLARGDAIVVGTTTCKEYEKTIAKDVALRRRFQLIDVEEPRYDEIKNMIGLKLEGLQNFHNVKISEEVLDYAITIAYCFNSELCNPDKTISLCDSAMAIAENNGDAILTKEHINEVYSDNFAKLKTMSGDFKTTLALHEAGHYVVWKLLSSKAKQDEVVAISIVPGFGFLGANVFEPKNELCFVDNEDFYYSRICVSLAGRIAAGISSGDRSDLKKATIIANEMVTEFGMSQKFNNISFDSFDQEELFYINEKVSKKVNKEVMGIIATCYEKTTKLIEEHKIFLTGVATELANKNILSKNDLDSLYEDYFNQYLSKK